MAQIAKQKHSLYPNLLNDCSKMANPSSLLVTDGAVQRQAEEDQYILYGVAEEDACELGFTRKYDLIPSIVCSVCFLLGLIYCFFGKSLACKRGQLELAHVYSQDIHIKDMIGISAI